jgi:D-alanyl-lipoteichoic acid acyltransferase DltB (MBOAT superfamily)
MVFKYFNVLNANISVFGDWIGFSNPFPFLKILLPIGLSFHTFQALSYTIEVYRRNQKAERHLGIFALYVMFYPQLVAGPIERPQNLLHQFREQHDFEYARVTDGLKLMLWGFFKKVVVADRLAPFVNAVYDHPHQYAGISVIVATVFFALQIYCDFSGYSDIAIGSAQVMGFRLMRNFNLPYFSRSISEFWRRWHISLSTWFRDYVYIPLGGSRVSTARRYLNLMITFLLSGLWHGANWTYVVWGGLNGGFLVVEQAVGATRYLNTPATASRALRNLAIGGARIGLTFFLICITWIFFRAHSLLDAMYLLGHVTSGLGTLWHDLHNLAFVRLNVLMRIDKIEFLIAIAAIVVVFIVEAAQSRGALRDRIRRQPALLRWGLYYAATAAVLFFGAFNSSQEFIYFQF